MATIFFAENLQFLRKKLGFKQDQIAKEFEIPRTTWSSYEKSGGSEPAFEVVKGIADFFDISVDDLLGKDMSLENDSPDFNNKIDRLKSRKKSPYLKEGGRSAVEETSAIYAKGLIETQKLLIESRDNEIKELKQKITEKDLEINTLNERISELEKENSELKKPQKKAGR